MTEPSAEPRTVRTLGIAAPGRPEFFSYDLKPVEDGQFRVETLYTGLSAGTELTFVKGTNPYLSARWDAELGVFREGEPSMSYPVKILGYMEVGRVAETRTPDLAEGDRVAMTYGHRTGYVGDRDSAGLTRLPEELDPLLGIYVGQMGPICANGLLHAAAEVAGRDAELADGVRGRNVLVIGAGVVGLLTGLFARAHGAAEVLVADPDAKRLAAAAGLGLTPVADDGAESVWRECTSRWRSGPADAGADVVFQCRGQAASLATAMRAVRPQGTIVDLAFYQGGAPELRLGEEFHHKGLTVRCAQIGRVPRGLADRWDRARLSAETLALLAGHGDDVRRELVTDVVPFEDAPQVVVELAERRRSTVQAVFALPS